MNAIEAIMPKETRTNSLSRTWGTDAGERDLIFPCDEIIPAPDDAVYRGITIAAHPHVVFRWLCQMRVAPYSYDWIDNLGRPSPRELTPALEQLAIGQTVMRDFELVDFAADQHLTLRVKSALMTHFADVAVSYQIVPQGERVSRLLVKVLVRYRRGMVGWLMRHVLPWADLVMMRRQLLNFKQLAERTATEMKKPRPVVT
jgi:hypothetical protein